MLTLKAPKTSIVIASFSSIKHLEKCLTSLQSVFDKTEIIISTIFTPDETRALQKQFKAIYLYNPEERNLNSIQLRETRVFRLRTRGIQAAQGEIIALLEDHCEATPQWLQSMQVTLSDCLCIAAIVVAGTVDTGGRSRPGCADRGAR